MAQFLDSEDQDDFLLNNLDEQTRQQQYSNTKLNNQNFQQQKYPQQQQLSNKKLQNLQLNVNQQQLDNYILCWGRNKDGELSCGTDQIIKMPAHPKGLNKVKLKQVSSGRKHTGLVTKNGTLLMCGSKFNNNLGMPGISTTNLPKFTENSSMKGKKVKQIACGDYHTICVLENGEVYSWGGSLHGKLGQKNEMPAQISSLEGIKIVQIGCGECHSVALSDKGEVYSWGGGGVHKNFGQLGHGNTFDIFCPQKIVQLQGIFITQIDCGEYHTVALSDTGKIYSWGSSIQGACGFGEFVNSTVPRQVKINFKQMPNEHYYQDFEPEKIIKICCGGDHTVFLSDRGRVYTCGQGDKGQLGLRSQENQKEPKLVSYLSTKFFVDIAAGWFHTILLSDKGDVFTCGNNSQGQLGIEGSESIKKIFTHVYSTGGLRVAKIFAGGDHSWVAIDDGSPYIEDYEPPSPIKVNEVSQLLVQSPLNSKTVDHSPDQSYLKDINQEQLQQIQQREKNEKSVQIIYCDVERSHKFIRFVLKDEPNEQFKKKMDQFMLEMDQNEQGIEYTRLQNDYQIFEEQKLQKNSNQQNSQGKFQNSLLQKISSVDLGNQVSPTLLKRTHTLMIISDPRKIIEQQNLHLNQENNQNFNNIYKQSVIGDIIILKESEINKSEFQKNMCFWFLSFAKRFQPIVDRMVFQELRPQQYIHIK